MIKHDYSYVFTTKYAYKVNSYMTTHCARDQRKAVFEAEIAVLPLNVIIVVDRGYDALFHNQYVTYNNKKNFGIKITQK